MSDWTTTRRCLDHRLLLTIGIVGGAVLLSGCGRSGTDCADYRFDRGAWTRALDQGGRDNPREDMARALMDCRELIGKRPEEVMRLLGRPSRTSKSDGGRLISTYLIGTGLTDDRYLSVQFDRRPRVSRVSTYER